LIIANGAEEVRLEQGADLGVVAFFDRGAITVAGIVDQYVDAATEPLLGLLHDRGDLLGFGDVKGGGEHALRCRVGQIGHLRDVACGDDSIVAGPDDSVSERSAKSGRAACDKPGGHERRLQSVVAPGVSVSSCCAILAGGFRPNNSTFGADLRGSVMQRPAHRLRVPSSLHLSLRGGGNQTRGREQF
jgi:hypothetical protein